MGQNTNILMANIIKMKYHIHDESLIKAIIGSFKQY